MVDFSKVAGVVLYTSNMERAIAFYTEVLGLEVVESEPSFVTLQTKNVKLYLHLTKNSQELESDVKMPSPQVSFKVDDIDEAFNHLKQVKVNITREIVEYNPRTYVFNFVDPDGNSLACECDRRKNKSIECTS